MATLDFRHPDSLNHKKYLDQATEIAKVSEQKHRHGAIIRKSGKTIAVGINRRTNDPYFMDDETAKHHASIHAEVAALKACRKTDLSGATIYIARVNKRNEPMMSKPCDACQKALKEAGIKKVYYTIDSSLELN